MFLAEINLFEVKTDDRSQNERFENPDEVRVFEKEDLTQNKKRREGSGLVSLRFIAPR